MYIYKPEITWRRFAVKELTTISSPSEVCAVFQGQILGPIERIACLMLNPRNTLVDKYIYSEITSGTADYCNVFIRNILELCLLTHATRFVLAHNHPTGNLSPSAADDVVTKKVKDGAKLLDIEMLDHIIVTETGYYSYQEQNRL